MSSTVVQVAYGTDVEALRPLLLARLLELPRVMKDAGHAPAVHLTAFAADGLELTIWYWNADPENGQSNLRSDVNHAILAVLTAVGAEIPFPQRVLHWPVGAAAPPAG